MEDKCVICGADVSDTGKQICNNCAMDPMNAAKVAEELKKVDLPYFDEPTQVMVVDIYADVEEGEEIPTIGAIAYRDEFICGICGGRVNIAEYYDDAITMNIDGDLIIPYDEWVDISEVIKGE